MTIQITKIVDSAVTAAFVDNLMDSPKAGCPQVTHNRLDKPLRGINLQITRWLKAYPQLYLENSLKAYLKLIRITGVFHTIHNLYDYFSPEYL